MSKENGIGVLTHEWPWKSGKELANGAMIIAARKKEDNFAIVLALWTRGRDDTEFVTWTVDREGNASSGHYFDENIKAAVDDFLSR